MDNQAPVKITVEIPGTPTKVFEADDFLLLYVKNKTLGTHGLSNNSYGLCDGAYWSWKVGQVMAMMQRQVQAANAPSGLIVPK